MTNLNKPTQTYRSLSRRRYSRDFKRSLAQQLVDGESSLTLAQLARTHDIHPNLLGKWRREYLQGKLGEQTKPSMAEQSFLPVTITSPATLPERADVAAALMVSSLELRLRKGSIVLEGSFTVDVLRDLVEALQ
ncbi:MAG: transposase [Porticoccaceae bacterium]|jgi:transposase|nr:transposase [Porticoccaceae bacterium]